MKSADASISTFFIYSIMKSEPTIYSALKQEIGSDVTLVAVSKTKPTDQILRLYENGQRAFGENYVQELVEKHALLPHDIQWHFIGHLQTNKVKYIAPFVHLIHGIDSFKLLKEVNKEAFKNKRSINVLLQIHIAQEETKFGLDEQELEELINQMQEQPLLHVKIIGMMGMASFSEDSEQVRSEFHYLKSLFCRYQSMHLPNFEMQQLSMGMSSDYKIALSEGSTMIRIGSLLFGSRS